MEINEALELIKLMAKRLRDLKNRARRERKCGCAKYINASYEMAVAELTSAYSDLKALHKCYGSVAADLLVRRYERIPVSEFEFNAVKHLIKVSPERLEALKSALVHKETYLSIANRYGWTKQAVGFTIKLFYEKLKEHVDSWTPER